MAVIGVFFGPLAAAVVSFINLKRLGQSRKANLTLALSIPGTFLLFGFLYWVPGDVAKFIPKSLVPALTGLIYSLLQNRDFDLWESSHPGVAPANGWTTAGWGLLGLLATLLVAVAMAVPVLFFQKVEDISVRFYAPPQFAAGEEFDFEVEIENTAEKPQRLDSIDLPQAVLENIDILRTDPPFVESGEIPFTHERTYSFGRAIPSKGRLAVKFRARGRKAADFAPAASVCIEAETNCEDFQTAAATEGSPSQ